MSTPKWKKEARKRQHQLYKEKLKYDEIFAKARNVVRSHVTKPYTPPQPYRREIPYIPSMNSMRGIAVKKEPQKYTGTLIKGIATMHKSNAVPVLSKEHATDISNMGK